MATYAGTNTCAAMAKHHELVLQHETKHHDQFVKYYAKPLMDAIDSLNATYHYEYCSLAFEASEMPETAENDAILMHERRYLLMLNPTFLNIRLKQAKNRIISPFFRFPKKLTR